MPRTAKNQADAHAALPRSRRIARTSAAPTRTASDENAPIAAVERALQVLNAFRANPRLSLEALAQATGLYKSTLLRILNTLAGQGYVFRLASGDYHIGGVLFELGSRYVESLRLEELVRPALEDLAKSTGESAAFYVRFGESERQCMLCADSLQTVRAVILPGQIAKLGKEATSLVFAKHRKAGERPSSTSDFARRTQFTSAVGDSVTASVAAPVFNSSGLLGVLLLAGPVHRLNPATVASFCTHVAEAAAALSLKLGGIKEPASTLRAES
ncbi:MAG: transcriptional regulator [Rubritepida sp.]|nr:transcriptional regulator [Rubritepida sp.]